MAKKTACPCDCELWMQARDDGSLATESKLGLPQMRTNTYNINRTCIFYNVLEVKILLSQAISDFADFSFLLLMYIYIQICLA
jgi:hypothetical protein